MKQEERIDIFGSGCACCIIIILLLKLKLKKDQFDVKKTIFFESMAFIA